jgi:hypothetical protein
MVSCAEAGRGENTGAAPAMGTPNSAGSHPLATCRPVQEFSTCAEESYFKFLNFNPGYGMAVQWTRGSRVGLA